MDLMKIYLNEKTKRCCLPRNYLELRETITRSFPSECTQKYYLYYMDEDYDLIFIENDYDYLNAIIYMKILRPSGCESNILKIFVTFAQLHESESQIYHTTNAELGQDEEVYYDLENDENYYKGLMLMKLKLRYAFKRWKLAANCDVMQDLQECKKCNRTFIESSLQKHIKCCAFMMKKREKFLSQKQRILNLEHFIFVRRLNVQNLKCQFSHLYEILFPFMQKKCIDKRYKMKNWKKKSFNLRYIIKVNKLLRRCKKCM